MKQTAYAAPIVRNLGSFRSSTNGVWFGKCRDIFGGKAFICIR